MKLCNIADSLDFTVIGSGEKTIISVKYPEYADDTSLVYIVGKRGKAYNGRGVILSAPKLYNDKYDRLVYYGDESAAAVRCAELLIKQGELPNYCIEPEYRQLKNIIYVGKNVEIGRNTVIEPFTVIGDNVIIGNNCYIGSSVHIGSGCVIGNNVRIGSGSRICTNAIFHVEFDGHLHVFAGIGKAVIGNGCEIGCGTVIQRGTFSDTFIGEYTMIGDLVDIGHDVIIGSDCRITSQSGISGGAVIENRVCILGQAGVAEYITIGHNAVVKGRTAVTRNIEPYAVISGSYGRNDKEELRFQSYLRKRFKERKSD